MSFHMQSHQFVVWNIHTADFTHFFFLVFVIFLSVLMLPILLLAIVIDIYLLFLM